MTAERDAFAGRLDGVACGRVMGPRSAADSRLPELSAGSQRGRPRPTALGPLTTGQWADRGIKARVERRAAMFRGPLPRLHRHDVATMVRAAAAVVAARLAAPVSIPESSLDRNQNCPGPARLEAVRVVPTAAVAAVLRAKREGLPC
jgi:hypothetical protein